VPELTNLEWETRVGYPRRLVAGCDEVGRGCLAGPVAAGAVLLPRVIDLDRDPWLLEVTDSKKLSADARERLAPLIEGWAESWAVAIASVEEIDEINIYHASHRAMVRAVALLAKKPQHLLVDGNRVPKDFTLPATPVVKGDLKCLSIAAASILAKVWRDRKMAELDSEYPGYGFAGHKGYPTPQHSRALEKLGPCAVHRRSFGPVAALSRLSLSSTPVPGPGLAQPGGDVT
jgi:ribonuclease HII